MKLLLFLSFICFQSLSFAQNGYVEQVVVSGDTTSLFQGGQIYWKLEQGFSDAIVESKKGAKGGVSEVKYVIQDRMTDGFVKEYEVRDLSGEEFTIRFHSRDRIVTYIYADKTVMYRGKNIRFNFEEIPSR